MSLASLQWSRRVLLRNLALVGAAAPLYRARAAAPQRRHLINIVVRGGWDAFWFHNALEAAEVAGHTASSGALVGSNGQFVEPPGSANYQGILNPSRVLTDAAPPGWPHHVRCPDSFVRPHQGTLLGPGFSQFTAADLQSLCIWKGIKSEGGHDTGNRILQTGATGDQTSSFPALIAAELGAQRGLLPLHYTQLARSRSELANQKGPLSLSDPVMIPDLATWQALTAPSAREPGTVQRQHFDAALARLSGLNRLAQPSNQAAYQSFAAAHRGAVELMLSGHAQGPDFTSTHSAYVAELGALASTHVFGTWFPLARPNTSKLAFALALAEFLVRHDLAAVVDLPGLVTDFHIENDSDAMVMLANLTGLKLLIRRLKATPLPEGGTLLDRTTVAMHTEFERSPTLVPNFADVRRAGTQHWDFTTSVFLSGAGIAGGRVVGDISRPAGTRAPPSTYPLPPFTALPIDLQTGLPSPTGTVVSVRSLYPTLLEAFGAGARSQLKVTAPVVKALLA